MVFTDRHKRIAFAVDISHLLQIFAIKVDGCCICDVREVEEVFLRANQPWIFCGALAVEWHWSDIQNHILAHIALAHKHGVGVLLIVEFAHAVVKLVGIATIGGVFLILYTIPHHIVGSAVGEVVLHLVHIVAFSELQCGRRCSLEVGRK